MRLITKTLILTSLFSVSAWGQSNTSSIELPSIKWKRLKDYVSTDLFYTHDYVSNTGGQKAGPRNIGALDIYFESDMSKYSSVPGQMMFHFIHINQNDNRGAIGDSQAASNIDMPEQVDRVVDLWYQHNWSDKFNTLFGLHDISMEFNVTESSLSFLNSSFGTNAELALTTPSLYPITSLGVRAHYFINDELSLRTGFYDSNPGDESTYRSFHSDIGNHEGYMHVSELAHQDDGHKMAIGGWNHLKKQANQNDESEATAWGSYALYEKEVSPSTWIFARMGWANPEVSAIHTNASSGVAYKGLFQRKKSQDEIGFGATRVHFSRMTDATADETAYETYYNFKPIKMLSLRPDVQYITRPSGLPEIKDAWAFGVRSVIEI